jgi:L-threonylcarbamoyladenylate synthase
VRIVDTTLPGIAQAVEALCSGEVIAYPTETIYGLGCDPFSNAALTSLFSVKKRDAVSPVLLIIGEQAHLDGIVGEVSPRARACMDAFWPGPVTLLLAAAPGLNEALVGPGGKVGVRYTSSPTAASLCRDFGGAVTSTSANQTGKPSANSVGALTLPGIALAVDGGTIEDGVPSSVFDPDTGRVVRGGVVPGDVLRAACGL